MTGEEARSGGIDAVMLVVAADESVMPQTREHFEICRLLRVPAGVVALTKADLADADMIAVVRDEVEDLVRGSFLDGAPIVAEAMDRGAAACFNKAMIVREATRFVTLIKSVARGLIEAEAEPVAIAA